MNYNQEAITVSFWERAWRERGLSKKINKPVSAWRSKRLPFLSAAVLLVDARMLILSRSSLSVAPTGELIAPRVESCGDCIESRQNWSFNHK